MLKSSSEDARDEAPLPRKEKYRVPAVEILPSERFPFSVHLDVLKRFVTLSHNGNQPLEAYRVEGEGIPTQGASLNVRFLKSVGLLETADRGQYVPTGEAIKFVTARSVSDEKSRPILAALIEATWIASTARGILSSTTATIDEVLLGELAIAAQTDKEKKEAALRVLVDYLLFSGLIRRIEDGLILAGPPVENTQSSQLTADRAGELSMPSTTGSTSEQVSKGWHIIQTEDFVLRVRSNVGAIDDLIEHLKILRRKIERLQNKEEKLLENDGPAGGAN